MEVCREEERGKRWKRAGLRMSERPDKQFNGGFAKTIRRRSSYFNILSVPLLYLCKINYLSGNKWATPDLSPGVFFSITHIITLRQRKSSFAKDHPSCIANLIFKWDTHLVKYILLMPLCEALIFSCYPGSFNISLTLLAPKLYLVKFETLGKCLFLFTLRFRWEDLYLSHDYPLHMMFTASNLWTKPGYLLSPLC